MLFSHVEGKYSVWSAEPTFVEALTSGNVHDLHQTSLTECRDVIDPVPEQHFENSSTCGTAYCQDTLITLFQIQIKLFAYFSFLTFFPNDFL